MSSFNFKYRPQKISELSLTQVREGLTRLLSSGKIPHAFLFAGPKGTGKTSAARIIAKAVNCQQNGLSRMADGRTQDKKQKTISHKPQAISQFEPCNTCSQCLSITAGSNLDILEIDAASNRGIDDIRDLREKVKLAPSAAVYKVYIIDEAHMLTTEAFNALLKTLEEPPKHVIFILCTTEPEKLPETIISRCQRFNFKRGKEEEIVEKLKRIVEEEKLVVEPEALGMIAKGAGGSFRDALKVLEQASYLEEKITTEDVQEILGQTAGLEPEKLLEMLSKKDVRGGIQEINRVVQGGGNLRIYTEQLLERLRAGLLAKVGVTQEEREIWNWELGMADFKKLIEIFSKAALELKEAIIPQLPLELAMVEWCETESQKLDDEDESLSPSQLNTRSAPSAGGPTTQNPSRSSKISLEDVQSRWQEVLSGVRPKNYSIEAFLRASRPIDFDGQVLTLEVFYKFHKEKLESDKCRFVVEEVASRLFGLPLQLKCTLGQKPSTVRKEKEEAEEIEEFQSKREGPTNGETDDEDIIKVAEEIFNGKKTD